VFRNFGLVEVIDQADGGVPFRAIFKSS